MLNCSTFFYFHFSLFLSNLSHQHVWVVSRGGACTRFGLFKQETFSDLIIETVNLMSSFFTPIVDEFFFVLFFRVPQEPFICDRLPVVIYFGVFSNLLVALFDFCFSLLFKHRDGLWCKFSFHFLFLPFFFFSGVSSSSVQRRQSKTDNKRIMSVCTTFAVNIYRLVICVSKANQAPLLTSVPINSIFHILPPAFGRYP